MRSDGNRFARTGSAITCLKCRNVPIDGTCRPWSDSIHGTARQTPECPAPGGAMSIISWVPGHGAMEDDDRTTIAPVCGGIALGVVSPLIAHLINRTSVA